MPDRGRVSWQVLLQTSLVWLVQICSSLPWRAALPPEFWQAMLYDKGTSHLAVSRKASFLGLEGRATKAETEAYDEYSFQCNFRQGKPWKRLFTETGRRNISRNMGEDCFSIEKRWLSKQCINNKEKWVTGVPNSALLRNLTHYFGLFMDEKSSKTWSQIQELGQRNLLTTKEWQDYPPLVPGGQTQLSWSSFH